VTTELQKLKAEKAPSKDWDAIVTMALEAAKQAAIDHITANPDAWYPCGFSWVNIKPARGPLIQVMKDRGLGYTDTYYGGYTVYNPSSHHTQWMDAKIAGSKAFVEALKPHLPPTMTAKVCSRID